jgi:hypothetical protein
MNEQFVVGDHVTRPDMEWTGVIVSIDLSAAGRRVFIIRDDGVRGGGPNGEWRVAYSQLQYAYPEDKAQITLPGMDTIKNAAKPHIPGLDPETCDWDAHKSFIRGLG